MHVVAVKRIMRSMNDQQWPSIAQCTPGQRGLVVVDNGLADCGLRELVVTSEGQADCGQGGLVIIGNGQADCGQRGLVVLGDGQADSGQRGLVVLSCHGRPALPSVYCFQPLHAQLAAIQRYGPAIDVWATCAWC